MMTTITLKTKKFKRNRLTEKNSFNTLVDNKLKSSSHLEDPNETDDWKTTNNHEGKLVMA